MHLLVAFPLLLLLIALCLVLNNGSITALVIAIPLILFFTALYVSVKGLTHGIRSVKANENPVWRGYIGLLGNGILVLIMSIIIFGAIWLFAMF